MRWPVSCELLFLQAASQQVHLVSPGAYTLKDKAVSRMVAFFQPLFPLLIDVSICPQVYIARLFLAEQVEPFPCHGASEWFSRRSYGLEGRGGMVRAGRSTDGQPKTGVTEVLSGYAFIASIDVGLRLRTWCGGVVEVESRLSAMAARWRSQGW